MLSQSQFSQQRGMAMVSVLLLSLLLVALMAGAAQMVMRSNADTTQQFIKHGQASNVAQAGLQDAVGWFKKQSSQPVKYDSSTDCSPDKAFAPQYNVDELLSDTIDANVGIVRDLPIDGNVYGRYIIKKQEGCPTDSGYKVDPVAVHDFTDERNKQGSGNSGVVWKLTSTGVVYVRNDLSKDATDGYRFLKGPDEAPNRVLKTAKASIEISRLAILVNKIPLSIFGTASSSFNNRCRIIGDTNTVAGVEYTNHNPNVSSVNFSLPTGANQKTYKSSATNTDSIFAVSKNELRGMADNVYTNVAQMPDKLNFSITYLDGSFTFDVSRPLVGSGLLYVNGNLTLQDSSNSLFSGVIYVDGRLTMGKDNSLSGAVVAERVTCTPGTGQASFEYTDNLVENVRRKLGLYRVNNLTHTIEE